MKADYLYGTPYVIEQGKHMYHFSQDTEFLGRMLEIDKGESVLDAGVNNGALLLYASMHTDRLCGIDLFDEVIALAEKNLSSCGIHAELYVSSLQKFQHEPFDVIVCNPPYFHTGRADLLNENPYLRAARHDIYLPLEDLFAHASRLLNHDSGRLEMIHLPAMTGKCIREGEKNRLYLQKIRRSWDSRDHEEKPCVMIFGRKKTQETEEMIPADRNSRDSFAHPKEAQ